MKCACANAKELKEIGILICSILSSLRKYQNSTSDKYREMVGGFLKNYMTCMNRKLLFDVSEMEAFDYGFSAQNALEALFLNYDKKEIDKIKFNLSQLCERLNLNVAFKFVKRFGVRRTHFHEKRSNCDE